MVTNKHIILMAFFR